MFYKIPVELIGCKGTIKRAKYKRKITFSFVLPSVSTLASLDAKILKNYEKTIIPGTDCMPGIYVYSQTTKYYLVSSIPASNFEVLSMIPGSCFTTPLTIVKVWKSSGSMAFVGTLSMKATKAAIIGCTYALSTKK